MYMSDDKSSEPNVRWVLGRLQGAGAGNPVQEIGQGITVTWVSTGLYNIAFSENVGTFLGAAFDLGAATPANLKQCSIVRSLFTQATQTAKGFLQFTLYDGTGALRNLAANEFIDFEVYFKAGSV